MAESNSQKKTTGDSPGGCEQAFVALRTYAAGSSRSALLPIDRAVTAALKDAKARKNIEEALLGALRDAGSAVAKDYICSKLALVGSSSAVRPLASLLSDPHSSTAARNALQAIPGDAALKALREQLGAVDGPGKIGIINSIGARRDAAAVGILTRLLRDTNAKVADAAAAALGEIGNTKAARALRDYCRSAPPPQRRALADALLVCANRLSDQGNRSAANETLKLLLTGDQPDYIRRAAERGIRG